MVKIVVWYSFTSSKRRRDLLYGEIKIVLFWLTYRAQFLALSSYK